MRCPYCGKENEEGRVICSGCLKPLKAEKNSSRKKILIAGIAAVVIVAAVLIIVLSGPKQDGKTAEQPDAADTTAADISSSEPEEASEPEITEAEISETREPEPLAEDVDAYFRERGEIIGKTEATASQEVHTEAEVISELKDRGITQYSVTAEYSLNGAYFPARESSETSGTKHPVYETYYVAANGDIWTISEINGRIYAYPVTVNMKMKPGMALIVSETNTIMSYDSRNNCFYETIPDPSALLVKTVERIDAETLERLSTERVDNE